MKIRKPTILDILHTLTNSGTALKTSARELVRGHVKMTVYANQLEHQVREQAEQIERLKDRIENLLHRMTSEEAAVEIERLHRNIDINLEQLEKAEAALAAAEEKLDASMYAVNKLEGELTAERAHRERVEKGRDELQAEVNSYRAQLINEALRPTGGSDAV